MITTNGRFPRLICLVFAAFSLRSAAIAGSGGAVLTGFDVLARDGFAPLQGKRVGLITNPTGVTRELASTIDVLAKAPGVTLVALFGPEHGVRGDIAAGEHVDDAKDAATGLPVFSLYGKTRKPTPEMLKGIDTLVFDMQDIGSRSYTYISTMAVAMEAAAEQKIDFVVLDRPNPLGGERVEGRPLDLKYKSFVGWLPIPYLHGMTVGELARMTNAEGWLKDGLRCQLQVVPMDGWRRNMSWRETGLPWVPTSPHVPHAESAYFYAATGILGELHVMSEGVGWPAPFEFVGRSGIDAQKFATALNERNLAGVHFRPAHFKPFYGEWKEKDCGGAQVHLTDANAANLTEISFHVLDAARVQQPEMAIFGNKRDDMFDKVCGTNLIREKLKSGAELDDVLKVWREGVDAFREQRAKYLLY